MKFHQLLTFILAVFTGALVSAQEAENVFTKVETGANTDRRKWMTYIRTGTQLPDSVIQAIPDGQYKVKVQFVINQHGDMGQLKLLEDPGYGLGQRALRLVGQYPGRWTPANQCGRNVKAYKQEVIVYEIKKPVVENNNR
ncbi:MAG: hypothetical protein QM781_07900 [Chitinophagaceae bacterium]